jgi:hypothetical protein
MNNIIKIPLQAVAYTAFCIIIYFLSTEPAYHYLESDQAEIKLAFKHASQRVQKCVKRTRKELMKLPPNMRKANDCPRERAIVQVEIILDDKQIAKEEFVPPGLHQDATVFAYSKLPLPVGEHVLFVGMRDSARTEGYDYEIEKHISIKTGQALVVGFDALKNKLTFSY